MEFSATGAVEFTEVDSLPGSEDEASLIDEDFATESHEGSFDVRITVSFRMTISGCVFGDQSPEREKHIGDDIRVGVFVDRDACGGVGDINQDAAVFDSGTSDIFRDQIGNFKELVPTFG